MIRCGTLLVPQQQRAAKTSPLLLLDTLVEMLPWMFLAQTLLLVGGPIMLDCFRHLLSTLVPSIQNDRLLRG